MCLNSRNCKYKLVRTLNFIITVFKYTQGTFNYKTFNRIFFGKIPGTIEHYPKKLNTKFDICKHLQYALTLMRCCKGKIQATLNNRPAQEKTPIINRHRAGTRVTSDHISKRLLCTAKGRLI